MHVPHDLACVVHVHSTFSDGRAGVPEILDAARAGGADAVLLTDHDTVEARRRGLEGWHGGVLLLVGLEVSPRGGHLLAFRVSEEIDHRGLGDEEIAAEVRRTGGLGFAAHPFSEGSRMSTRIGRPHPWTALEAEGVTGIELWSVVTEAAEAWRSPLEALRFMRRPEDALDGPPARNLREWDRLCASRRCVGIGGLDAHESGLRLGGRVLSPFRNLRYFRFLRTHVLLEGPPRAELEPDRDAVYGALAEGRCYLAMDWAADPKGFGFWAEGAPGRLEMGAQAPAGEWTLRARTPRPAALTLVRDGAVEARADGARELVHEARGAGVYRVEARIEARGRERTWIVSNPVYLRDGGAQAAPQRESGAREGHGEEEPGAEQGRQ